MEFRVQAESFKEGLSPAISVASKDIDRDFDDGGKVTLDVTEDKIIASSHGGGAQVVSEISDDTYPDLDYKCVSKGNVTLDVDEFVKALDSFSAKDVITISDTDGLTIQRTREVVTAKTKKKIKEEQAIPLQTDEDKVLLTEIPDDFDVEVTVNKDVFLKGMDKVNFAIGFEDSRPDFNCQPMIVSKKKLRFVAGTGARFAVMDFEGKGLSNLLQIDSPVTILFPKHNISNLLSLLSKSDEESIVIKQSSNKLDFADQIVVEFGGHQFVFLKINPTVKYPQVDKIVKKDYSYKVTTSLLEWKDGIAGIVATNTLAYQQDSPRHNAEIESNFNDGLFHVTSKTNAKADRYVTFSEIISQNGEETDNVGFRCNSRYLGEMLKKGDSSDDIDVSFENQFKDEDAECPPVLVNYPSKENENLNITDTFHFFFSVAH
tara:strand:- start:9922 stop:11217 length:1296 start_codon:yes stop_codon:yes gene_type:complete